MVRVFHIITRMDMGGSAQNTLISCIGLSQHYSICLGFGPTSESRMTASERIAVQKNLRTATESGVELMMMGHLFRQLNPFRDFLAFLEILSSLRRYRPHILHTHSSKAGILGRLAALAARIPVVVHTPHGHVFYGHFSKFTSTLFLYIERLIDRYTDVTVTLTQGEWDDYVNMRVTTQHKMVKIHSGVDINRFSTACHNTDEKRASLGIDAGASIIGTVGWLLPIKGPDVLLGAMNDVWNDHPETHIVFVGKGLMEEELRRIVEISGKERFVHFLGWRDDIWDIMPLLDIFVLPSRNEGMGRVVVEAMAAGKPVIGSNVGGIPDLIEHSVNGLLFPSEDSAALAEAIRFLIQNPEKARAMGIEGQQRSKAYSTEAMIKKLDRLYSELIRKKKIKIDGHV